MAFSIYKSFDICFKKSDVLWAMKAMRPTYDEYFMRIAKIVATRSTCLRRQVGSVIVKDNHLLSTGYNGPPKGMKHCDETGCMREKLNIPRGERHELCRGLHAEQNAIIQAAVFGISIKDGTIYTTHFPCSVCAKMLVNAELKEIVYEESYPDELSINILEESNINMRQFRCRNE
jgi:dCMP deaminase